MDSEERNAVKRFIFFYLFSFDNLSYHCDVNVINATFHIFTCENNDYERNKLLNLKSKC